MAVDIFQMNAKKADGTLAPFYPVAHQKSVINAMAQAAVFMTNTQAITTSGYYQYSAATTNLPAGIPPTGYISASFVDPKNGLLMIQGTLWSRQIINGSWGVWQELSRDNDTGWVELPIQGSISSGVKMRRIGNLVKLSGSIKFATDTGPLLDWPQGFKPSQTSFSFSIMGQASGFQMLVLFISKNGVSVLRNTSNSTVFHLDSLSFLTDDKFPV